MSLSARRAVARIVGDDARCDEASVRRDEQRGVNQPPRAAGGILARFPEIPGTGDRVDGEQSPNAEGNGGVRWLDPRGWARTGEERLSQTELEAEQGQHCVAADAVDHQPRG